MAWFTRLRRKLRNYTSDSDYAGSHGGGQSRESIERSAKAQFEATVNRPDRFGGGAGGGYG